MKCPKLTKKVRRMLKLHGKNTSRNKAQDDSDQRIQQCPSFSTITSIQEQKDQEIQRKKHKDKYQDPHKQLDIVLRHGSPQVSQGEIFNNRDEPDGFSDNELDAESDDTKQETRQSHLKESF